MNRVKFRLNKQSLDWIVLFCCFLISSLFGKETEICNRYTLDLAKLRYQQLLGIELEKKMGLSPHKHFHAWSRMHPEIHQINFALVSPKIIYTIEEAREEILKTASIIFDAANDDHSGLSHFLLVKPFPIDQVNIDLDFEFDVSDEERMISVRLNWGTIYYDYFYGRYFKETYEEALSKLKEKETE